MLFAAPDSDEKLCFKRKELTTNIFTSHVRRQFLPIFGNQAGNRVRGWRLSTEVQGFPGCRAPTRTAARRPASHAGFSLHRKPTDPKLESVGFLILKVWTRPVHAPSLYPIPPVLGYGPGSPACRLPLPAGRTDIPPPAAPTPRTALRRNTSAFPRGTRPGSAWKSR